MDAFVDRNPNSAMVDRHTPQEWRESGAKMFAGSEDGFSFGAAVKPNGDVVGVVKAAAKAAMRLLKLSAKAGIDLTHTLSKLTYIQAN
jgi:hypothetical protein